MRILIPIAAMLLAPACSEEVPDITVSDPVVVTNPNGGVAYFTIRNDGGTDRLTGVETPGLGAAMIHEMSTEGGIMRMRQVAAITVPAGGRVRFERGGLHVMIARSTKPIAATTPLILTFERQGKVTLQAKVESAGAMGAM
jgi:copper(I)-binding protein